MMRYKVVTKDRKSSSALYNRITKYLLDYPKGGIVTAPEWSIGLLVFEKREQAIQYIEKMTEIDYPTLNLMILRVKPTSIGKKPNAILNLDLEHFEASSLIYSSKIFTNEFLGFIDNEFWSVPNGTICYRSVEVLD